MVCKNCGNANNDNSKFCVKCGQLLSEVQEESVSPMNQEVPVQNLNNNVVQNTPQQNVNSVQNVHANTNSVNTKVSFGEYFSTMFSFILKPFTAKEEKLNKFSKFKNSFVVALIVSLATMLINLITTMLNVVMIKGYDYSTMSEKTTWVWENLKELNYLELIGKNFLIYLAVIFAITVVYYVGSLIAKKETNFSRLLVVSSISIVPVLVCSMVLSPLMNLIWSELTMPLTIVGALYTLVLLYEGMNNEIKLTGNAKFYFNLVCISILGIALYYFTANLLMGSILGEIEGVMDMFG